MQAAPNVEHGEGSGLAAATDLNELSEDCVAKVISFTTPCDAARVSSVSKFLKSAADSDPVWETFLPSDYRSLVPASYLDLSKKELYLNFTNQPILIDDGKKSLYLDIRSGKICCMLAPRDLHILGIGDGTPLYWEFISLPESESRFPEVAELMYICWFEIRARIYTRMLSKETLYTVYFVYKLRSNTYGFEDNPVEVMIEHSGSTGSKRMVDLDYDDGKMQGRRSLRRYMYHSTSSIPPTKTSPGIRMRRDGWMEVELGEFYNNEDIDEELRINVREVERGNWKSGIIIQGLEFRPDKVIF